MEKSEMIVSLMIALCSGQLLLAIWQIIKEIRDRRKARQDAEKQAQSGDALVADMLKRVFRTTLKNQLQQVFIELDNQDKYQKAQLMLDLVELKDNMELYLKMGGNGAVHRLYSTLLKKLIADPSLMSFADVAWIEQIGSEIDKEA